VPVAVSGLSGVTTIAPGGAIAEHACALVGGVPECWGWNAFGQLGNNSTTDSHVPVVVSGFSGGGVQAISAGYEHTCAVNNNGALLCWGGNTEGDLGNNSMTESNVPVPVSNLTGGVEGITAAFNHSCAVVNGAVWCWGDNSSGDLGNNSRVQSSVPVQVDGL
jgi:alpha-tubulin suppressor-like RCC1 family protein